MLQKRIFSAFFPFPFLSLRNLLKKALSDDVPRESTVQKVDTSRKTVYLPYQFPFPAPPPPPALSCLAAAAAAIFILSSGETYLNRDLSIVVVVVFVVVIEFAELLLLLLLFWPLSLVHTRLGCGLVMVGTDDVDATDFADAAAAAATAG